MWRNRPLFKGRKQGKYLALITVLKLNSNNEIIMICIILKDISLRMFKIAFEISVAFVLNSKFGNIKFIPLKLFLWINNCVFLILIRNTKVIKKIFLLL
jgi:hypothetical protein